MKKFSFLRDLFLTVLLWALVGCTLAKVDVNVVSQRTALENQVLGSYNALSNDVLLVASVRGVDPTGKIETPPRKSREYQNAVTAMETLAFHEDDVDAFKRLGWVGENNVGLLTTFPITREKAPDDLQAFATRYQQDEFLSVVKQVNESREVVMMRVVETNAAFTQKDLPEIKRVFAKLNREKALPGERIQKEDGSWVTL
ncbi:MAG TPA: DUF1318 domain-containing protein [Desulfobacteria bacterium]|nr:DUF1318 domain-containing protein [Desulfobacteria bacterium]